MIDFVFFILIINVSASTQEALNWPLAHTLCGVPGEPLAKPDWSVFRSCFKIPTASSKTNSSSRPFLGKEVGQYPFFVCCAVQD